MRFAIKNLSTAQPVARGPPLPNLAAGDDHALAEVFDRFGTAVYGAAMRIIGDATSAQDVVQDVFVELWSRPDRYDPDAGPLRTDLLMLSRHRAVDLARSELRRIARQERHGRLDPQVDLGAGLCCAGWTGSA
jgi:RNA polymerase sigma-70 factor, ECF subfamily